MSVEYAITTHGQELTLTHVTSGGTYNPATGGITGKTTEEYTVKGYTYDYDLQEIDGTSVILGDRKLALNAKDIFGDDIPVPAVGDTLSGEGDVVSIRRVRKLMSGSTVRLYLCQVRE